MIQHVWQGEVVDIYLQSEVSYLDLHVRDSI
jgi:hypothetical protein